MKGLPTFVVGLIGLAGFAASQDVTKEKVECQPLRFKTAIEAKKEQLAQIQAAMKDTNGQVDTTDNGVQANTSDSLRGSCPKYNQSLRQQEKQMINTQTAMGYTLM